MIEERFDRALILLATLIAASTSAAHAQTCPPQGTARSAKEKDLNVLKNREDAPPAEQIDPNATLTGVLAPGNDLNRWSTDKGAVFEGIVLKVKSGDPETPNCGATDPAHQDTHIELALSPTKLSKKRVIVEVTPRWRQKMAVIQDWSTPALKRELLGRRVRITGWLLNDFIHKGQAENTHPNGLSNWRATVWEIHPITGIYVLPGPAVALAAPAVATSSIKAVHHRAGTKKKCARSTTHKCGRAKSRSKAAAP